MSITPKERKRLQKALKPCPFCNGEPRLIQSDGGDCRMSRDCRHGYYIKCWNCDLLFGYEPDRGGVWQECDLGFLVRDWNERKARARRVLAVPMKLTWAAARVNAGLTQRQVAEKLGVSDGFLCGMETGRYKTTPKHCQAMAKLYKVKAEWIEEKEFTPKPKRILLSDKARELRIEKSMTLKEAGEALGFSGTALAFYEKRQRPISQDKIEKLAELYGVMPEDLMEVKK